ncbi:MAG: hypothetical protein ACHQIM_14660, partial [Sphingobacteriales bacterium]
ARDGELQRPLTDPDGIAYINSKTEVGGADHVFDYATENLNNTGSALIIVGYLAAPITDGASLGLVGIGEGFNLAGTTVSITHDLTNGKVGSAAATAALQVGFGALGSAVKDSKGIETAVGKTILRGTVAAGGMVADKLKAKFATDHAQPKVNKNAPKFKDNPKQDKAVQDWFKKADEKKKTN